MGFKSSCAKDAVRADGKAFNRIDPLVSLSSLVLIKCFI